MSAGDERHLKKPLIAVSAVISSNQLLRIRLETTATLQVDIEVAPTQFVIWIGATSILKYQSFFNVKNYDVHFIIQNANRFRKSKEINAIAQNSEKFLTCRLEHLSIKDCFSVLSSSSSEKLVNLNRYEEGSKREKLQDNFKHSMNSACVKSDYDLDLLTEKGVRPYDYMNSLSKFNDKELPSIQGFYSKLSEEKTSQKDYDRALKAFNHFNLKDMGDYHDLYLTTDAFYWLMYMKISEICVWILMV